MDNHKSLNVMYIIWGQKIWNPSNGEAPTPWKNWRQMEDRGSVTNNHWYVDSLLSCKKLDASNNVLFNRDHPHVSFNAA